MLFRMVVRVCRTDHVPLLTGVKTFLTADAKLLLTGSVIEDKRTALVGCKVAFQWYVIQLTASSFGVRKVVGKALALGVVEAGG